VKHLTHDEHVKLHAAEQAAEAQTSARLVLAVVPLSDRYALYPIIYGALAGLLLLGLLALLLPDLTLRDGFFATAIAFFVVSLVLEWPPLKLLIVPKKVKHHHAREMAHRVFAARILAQADKKPGIALFAALGERTVEIVADRDVHSRVPQSVWDAIIADFSDFARKGRAVDGLLAAAETCTKVLEEHYPAK
jgi:putative membrane protein